MGMKDCYGYCRLCPQSTFNVNREERDGVRERPVGVCWMGFAHEIILKIGAYRKRQRILIGNLKYIPETLR